VSETHYSAKIFRSVVCGDRRSLPGNGWTAKMAHKNAAKVPRPSQFGRGECLKVAGLFAGVGGIELGLSRAGHDTALLCEVDPTAQAVLRSQFDKSLVFTSSGGSGDIKSLAALPSEVTLVTAGFPCQDLSQAGRTRGIRGSRSGLIGEVFRLLDRAKPSWVLIENVPFMLHLAKGEALYVIVAALEDLGYRWAYRVVDSRAFGRPQRRRRVYLLASKVGDPREVLFADEAGDRQEPSKSSWQEVACGFYWTEGNRGLGWTHDAIPTLKGGSGFGIPSAPAIVLPRGADGERIGTPSIEDAERLQGFDAGWTKAAAAADRENSRWRLIGNSVTVDAAEWIGRRLRSPGKYDQSGDKPHVGGCSWPDACYNVGGGKTEASSVSAWPFGGGQTSLAEYLEHPLKPLSARATQGFFNRFKASTLRKPPGFLDLVERHLDVMCHSK
jgi:DNA (cytosine-5)-methyltransferase 1